MKIKENKIIIDTNLLISFLISKNLKRLDNILINQHTKLVFSPESISEFLEVVNRPKFKKYFKINDILTLIKILDNYGILVEVKSHVQLCRDPKDNFLLSLAKDSKAHFILTGDKDLLEVGIIGNTKIVSITKFEKIK